MVIDLVLMGPTGVDSLRGFRGEYLITGRLVGRNFRGTFCISCCAIINQINTNMNTRKGWKEC